MISDSIYGAIIGGLGGVAMMLILDFCISRLTTKQRQVVVPEYGTYAGSKEYRVISVLFALFLCGGVYVTFFHVDLPPGIGGTILKYSELVLFVPFAYYIIKDAFFTRIILSKEGIEKKGIFGIQRVRWSDIDKVNYSSAGRCFELRGQNKRLMVINVLMEGIPVVVQNIRKRVASDALTQVLPMLDYFEEG